jgi:hypothetical protein
LELALPGFLIRSSLQYNTRITFHGLFMIFFMIMPILIGGFGNIPLPLLPCSSDMIFPRLNALSLWLVIDSLYLINPSLLLNLVLLVSINGMVLERNMLSKFGLLDKIGDNLYSYHLSLSYYLSINLSVIGTYRLVIKNSVSSQSRIIDSKKA